MVAESIMAEFIQLPDMRMHGSTKWELLTDCVYQSDLSDAPYIVPAGTITDLASIPQIFRSLIPQNDKHRPAAIVHDYLVHTIKRSKADRIFLEAMKVCGVPAWKRWSMYLAVALMTVFKRG